MFVKKTALFALALGLVFFASPALGQKDQKHEPGDGHNHGKATEKPTNQRQPVKEGEVGPDIEFETPAYDFERARAGVPVHHDFIFKNTGTKELRIDRVKPICGCTVTGDFETVLAPGASGKLPIMFETKKFRGKVSKSISVYTNVKGKEEVKIVIKGEVWQAIQIVPGSASFGSADPAKEQERVITITNNLPDPLNLTDLVCDSDKFNVDLEEIEEGKRYKLTVKTIPPLTNRFNRASITMNTNEDEIRMIQVMASAYVPPPVMVTPSLLRFPQELASDMRRYVYVRHTKGKDLKISDIEINAEELEVKVINDKPEGKAYRLVITAPKGYTLPEKGVQLSFKTDEPNFPIGNVPLRPLPKRQGGQVSPQAKASIKDAKKKLAELRKQEANGNGQQNKKKKKKNGKNRRRGLVKFQKKNNADSDTKEKGTEPTSEPPKKAPEKEDDKGGN